VSYFFVRLDRAFDVDKQDIVKNVEQDRLFKPSSHEVDREKLIAGWKEAVRHTLSFQKS